MVRAKRQGQCEPVLLIAARSEVKLRICDDGLTIRSTTVSVCPQHRASITVRMRTCPFTSDGMISPRSCCATAMLYRHHGLLCLIDSRIPLACSDRMQCVVYATLPPVCIHVLPRHEEGTRGHEASPNRMLLATVWFESCPAKI